jgi:F-type H+-transporting ATPase subunit a
VYAKFFYSIFVIVFLTNLLGAIPDVLTLTSFIVMPLFLSISFFIGSFLIVIYQNKFLTLKGFLPSGVPGLVKPFLFIIEVISYFIRVASLSIRLFINILAGHVLLKIFTIIVLTLIFHINRSLLPFILIFTLTFIFTLLEYIACFLQAIVLVSLIAIYINHALNFTH